VDRGVSPAALLLAAAAPALGPVPAVADRSAPADWRRTATPADRERLRGWRTAWIAARPLVPPGRDAELFDPDLAVDGALPPAGSYRCRIYRLGTGAGAEVQNTASRCRVGPDEGTPGFAVLDGDERPAGLLYPHTDARVVFLGSVLLAGEARPLRYGRDARRDAAGWVERIGPARWRLVLPYPRSGGTLDVVEIVPEEGGAAAGGT